MSEFSRRKMDKSWRDVFGMDLKEAELIELEKFMVYEVMSQFGGSFERALAVAISKADCASAKKIKDAFPELWDKWKNWKTK